MKPKFFVLGLSLILGWQGVALAKEAAAPVPPAPLTTPSTPATAPDSNSISTLKMFKDKGADVNYLGRLYGLDGWLITKDTAVEVVYTTPDGQASVVGLLYGPDGNLATSTQLQAAKDKGLSMPNTTAGKPPTTQGAQAVQAGQPAPATGAGAGQPSLQGAGGSPGERLWKDVSASSYITVGAKTAPILYVFVDPRCHYCQAYWQTLTGQYLPKNAVQLRLIPVGILGPDSEHIAQQVLSAPDQAAAWGNVESNSLGALPTQIAPDAPAKLQANRDLMTKWNFSGTPYSVYRGKDGKVKIVYGAPGDVAQMIGDLGPAG